MIRGLANVSIVRGNYWIHNTVETTPAEEKLWTVLRDYTDEKDNPGYKLSKGDIIKFGKCTYTIKELIKIPDQERMLDNTIVENNENQAPIQNMEIINQD